MDTAERLVGNDRDEEKKVINVFEITYCKRSLTMIALVTYMCVHTHLQLWSGLSFPGGELIIFAFDNRNSYVVKKIIIF